eukprot:403373207
MKFHNNAVQQKLQQKHHSIPVYTNNASQQKDFDRIYSQNTFNPPDAHSYMNSNESLNNVNAQSAAYFQYQKLSNHNSQQIQHSNHDQERRQKIDHSPFRTPEDMNRKIDLNSQYLNYDQIEDEEGEEAEEDDDNFFEMYEPMVDNLKNNYLTKDRDSGIHQTSHLRRKSPIINNYNVQSKQVNQPINSSSLSQKQIMSNKSSPTQNNKRQQIHNISSENKDFSNLPSSQPNKIQNQDLHQYHSQNYQQNYSDQLKQNEANTSTEERLFKFSPLSSKKFDEEENPATNQTPVTSKNRFSLNNTQVENSYNKSSLYHPINTSQSPIPHYKQGQNVNISQMFSNNNLSRISQDDHQNPNLNTSIVHFNNMDYVTRQNTVIYDNENTIESKNEYPTQSQTIQYSTTTHKRENSLTPKIIAYKRDQTPQTAKRNSQFNVISTNNAQIQTEPRGPLMLSPFETYDLLFVRDTINNLNFDNEILSSNVEDLKNGFMYLYQKHKELQHQYNKESQNQIIVENYRKKVAELLFQNEKTEAENLQLKLKFQTMHEIMQSAIQEQFYSMQEDQDLILQLQTENEKLRELMNIGEQIHTDINIEEIHKILEESEKQKESFEYQQLQTESMRKMQEIEKIRMELTQEIEELLRQEFQEKFMQLSEQTAQIMKQASEKELRMNKSPSLHDEATQMFIDYEGDDKNINDSLSGIEEEKSNDVNSSQYKPQNTNDDFQDNKSLPTDEGQRVQNLSGTDEFKELFDGQPITQEEMDFIMELKKMQNDQFNQPQIIHKHQLQSDFAQMDEDSDEQENDQDQMDDDDEEEEDEDVKQLQRLLKQSKESGYYQNLEDDNNDNQIYANDDFEEDDEEEEDPYQDHQQNTKQDNNDHKMQEEMFEQIRKQNQQMQGSDVNQVNRQRSKEEDEQNQDFNDYMDDFEPDEDSNQQDVMNQAAYGGVDEVQEDDLDLSDGQKDAFTFSQEQKRKEQEFMQELQDSNIPSIEGGNFGDPYTQSSNQFTFDDDDDEEQFFKELAQDFQQNAAKFDSNKGSSRLAAIQSLSNPSLDHSNIKQNLVRQSQNTDDNEILFDLQREEQKEEEYDYFDLQDENMKGNNDYHVMDDNIQGNDDDDEMLDEDEIRDRNLYMLKELQDKFNEEDQDQQ